MISAPYDILRKEPADLVWIEAAHDLEIAKARVKELVASLKGEYVIYDQRARKIVSVSSTPAA